jgi:UDP-glucuronate 4-epimerase
MTYLVTGAAGFIGYHVSQRLLALGYSVVGLDNMNDYYDPRLKEARLARLRSQSGFSFVLADVADAGSLDAVFSGGNIQKVIHLAAQAGVRYSLVHPEAYIQSNLVGFANILECCRQHGNIPLLYASSSSVYGGNTTLPFSVHDRVDHPVSLYAATKRANELMAHSYSHLFGVPTTGLRFFTVYGPWGRPDMALFIFTKAILEGRPIQLFNNGDMARDFTYVDDIATAVRQLAETDCMPNQAFDRSDPDPASSWAPFRVFNVGRGSPVRLEDFVGIVEQCLGKQAIREYEGMQPGDVASTCADVTSLRDAIGYSPQTDVAEGVRKFVEWYRDYYAV